METGTVREQILEQSELGKESDRISLFERNKHGIRSQKWKGVKTNVLNRKDISFETIDDFLFDHRLFL